MCRSVEDCAAVLHAIAGPDGHDLAVPASVPPFSWHGATTSEELLSGLSVGYFASAFALDEQAQGTPAWMRQSARERDNARATLKTLEHMGVELVPVEVPQSDLIFFIEYCERAAAFDEFALQEHPLGEKRPNHWAHLSSQLVPAVMYLQANRARMRLMTEFAQAMDGIDILVSPWWAINPLTSMTGHPVIALQNGFTDDEKPRPTGIAMVGSLYGEASLLQLAKAYQLAMGYHRQHPDLGDL